MFSFSVTDLQESLYVLNLFVIHHRLDMPFILVQTKLTPAMVWQISSGKNMIDCVVFSRGDIV